ncbi:MAG: ABC transporter substrate-binding protein [Bdellovibrionota bacterium]
MSFFPKKTANCLSIAKYFLYYLLFLTSTIQISSAEQIKIGIISSLTGPAAKIGQNWLDGAKFAEHELDGKVKLIIEDDGTQAKNLVSAFAKLATVDKVDGIIGGTWDFLAESAFPLANQYKTPFITPTNPVEILSDRFKSSRFAYTNGLTLEAEKTEIRKLLKGKNIKSLGLAYVNVPYGTSHADLLRDLAQELKIKITGDYSISYENFAEDIKNSALKFSKLKPEFIFIVTNYEGTEIFAREIIKLKYSPSVLVTQSLGEAYELNKSPTLFKNFFGVYPKILASDFNSRFELTFKRKPKVFAGAGYDAVMFMAKALETGELARERNDIKYNGVTGTHSLPSRDGLLVRNVAEVMKLENGDLVSVLRD